MSSSAIGRAVASGRLHVVHDGVYSLMPTELLQPQGWLAAAILAGGPGARLYGHSAAHWAKLADRPPKIHVAVRHRRAEIPGIVWHRDAHLDVHFKYRRLPITAPHLIPSEVARDLGLWELKAVLAELEYHHDIGPSSVTVVRGRAGAARLRRAIRDHTPELAATRSHLERAFVVFLTERGFALPVFNHPVGLSTVDAVYEELRIAIELDGVQGHSGDRRLLRDHRRDLRRRHEGFTALRYAFAQLRGPDADLIAAELSRLGVRCAA